MSQKRNLIVDVAMVMDSPKGDWDRALGEPIAVEALAIGEATEVPDGGESRTYRAGQYELLINFDKAGLAKGVQVVGGLTADNYNLEQWALILRRMGVMVTKQPSHVLPMARRWANYLGYSISIFSNGNQVWSVKIFKLPDPKGFLPKLKRKLFG